MLTAGRAGRRPEGPLTPLLLGEYRLSRCARGLPRNPVACDVAPRVVRCPCRTHVTCTYRDLHQTRANIVITPSPRGFSRYSLPAEHRNSAGVSPCRARAPATVAPPSAACTPILKCSALGGPTAAKRGRVPPHSRPLRALHGAIDRCHCPLAPLRVLEACPYSPLSSTLHTRGASVEVAPARWRAAIAHRRIAGETSPSCSAHAPPSPRPSRQPSQPWPSAPLPSRMQHSPAVNAASLPSGAPSGLPSAACLRSERVAVLLRPA
jgi:hypothetical protein